MNSSLAQRENNQVISHIAWCALIALNLAEQEGRITKTENENTFLSSWLNTALVEKRFDHGANQEIHWLISQCNRVDSDAGVKHKLTILWNDSCGKINKESDLLRLTMAINSATKTSWIYKLIEPHQWEAYLLSLSKYSFNCIMINRGSLDQAFDEWGIQKQPINALIIGNKNDLMTCLQHFGWNASNDNGCLYSLHSVSYVDVFSA